ncbi:uncharacterized protein LOC107873242 isoform X3 [Capsicum annuum]|uniref:uncharacterized protein LOC107873242 isoform X3 n=1 Tax=Capsicum annuum TaxID=4072 RepID=UPI0007BEE4EA|nr:uncharacterized protein LOC107873242 isoform X3 [Capsicum annuum]XP_047270872.1 uncharacterized protein LOC107873242 isoform X3 [Capsicum annuum]
MNLVGRDRIESFVSIFVTVLPHELFALLYSSSTFFCILSAYFVVLPLRDEGAISLGLGNLPSLFVGSLLLTLLAAPLSTLIFSLPNLSKSKALVLIHRFFGVTLIAFYILWLSSTPGSSPFNVKELKVQVSHTNASNLSSWSNHGWFYVSVRIGLFLWVALLNLITISSTWARVIDVMDSESGSRLFGFIGAGATLGQLFGSLFATGMAWLGPYLLLVSAILMELAAQSSKGIKKDVLQLPEELSSIREADSDQSKEAENEPGLTQRTTSPKSSASVAKPQFWAVLDGLKLILSSTYLLHVALFLWLSAVVSSFFYFQKVTVIAAAVTDSTGRRRLFAQINSFIAIFILAGQLTLTGRILTFAGVTLAICSAPFVAFTNLIALAVWPTWIAVAISETLRKVVTYVVTRPARELLFTVVSQDEKYKAKVCIDVIVQRLGDATAAAMYKLLFSTINGKASAVSLYALPVCLTWILTAFYLGHRYRQLSMAQPFLPAETCRRYGT